MVAVLALLFYDGSLDAARLESGWKDSPCFFGGGGRSEAAGLEDAVWMIGAYLAVAGVLGHLISMFRDGFARRKRELNLQLKDGPNHRALLQFTR